MSLQRSPSDRASAREEALKEAVNLDKDERSQRVKLGLVLKVGRHDAALLTGRPLCTEHVCSVAGLGFSYQNTCTVLKFTRWHAPLRSQ